MTSRRPSHIISLNSTRKNLLAIVVLLCHQPEARFMRVPGRELESQPVKGIHLK